MEGIRKYSGLKLSRFCLSTLYIYYIYILLYIIISVYYCGWGGQIRPDSGYKLIFFGKKDTEPLQSEWSFVWASLFYNTLLFFIF